MLAFRELKNATPLSGRLWVSNDQSSRWIRVVILTVVLSGFAPGVFGQSTSLSGIKCDLATRELATNFAAPVKPVDGFSWTVSNGFGNVLTNEIGLEGSWQHTGLDYLLGGSSARSEKRTVYSAANGVVIFSTKTNPNPSPKRGGLVIIKHSVAPNAIYNIPEYKKAFTASGTSFTISYPLIQSKVVYTYYLHLNPDAIKVAQGDLVVLGQPIAETYSYANYTNKTFSYVPHLHFEVWKTCGTVERNGYDKPNTEFQQGVNALLLDPVSFLERVTVIALVPRVAVIGSLRISQGTLPSPGPFKVERALSGTFTIKNLGNGDLFMRKVLIGGRLDPDTCPDGRCPDFMPVYTNRTLRPGEEFTYFGNFTPTREGTYTFSVAYEKADGKWEIPVASENGAVNRIGVVVRNKGGPTLISASPTFLIASPYKQRVILSGTGLARTIYCQLILPNGTKKNIYIPLNQVFTGSEDRLRIETEFKSRGTYQIIAHTPLQKTNALFLEVR